MMKYVLALAICLSSAPAFATCKSEAAEKKLAGAALTSFIELPSLLIPKLP